MATLLELRNRLTSAAKTSGTSAGAKPLNNFNPVFVRASSPVATASVVQRQEQILRAETAAKERAAKAEENRKLLEAQKARSAEYAKRVAAEKLAQENERTRLQQQTNSVIAANAARALQTQQHNASVTAANSRNIIALQEQQRARNAVEVAAQAAKKLAEKARIDAATAAAKKAHDEKMAAERAAHAERTRLNQIAEAKRKAEYEAQQAIQKAQRDTAAKSLQQRIAEQTAARNAVVTAQRAAIALKQQQEKAAQQEAQNKVAAANAANKAAAAVAAKQANEKLEAERRAKANSVYSRQTGMNLPLHLQTNKTAASPVPSQSVPVPTGQTSQTFTLTTSTPTSTPETVNTNTAPNGTPNIAPTIAPSSMIPANEAGPVTVPTGNNDYMKIFEGAKDAETSPSSTAEKSATSEPGKSNMLLPLGLISLLFFMR